MHPEKPHLGEEDTINQLTSGYTLGLRPGTWVVHQGRRGRVVRIANLQEVHLRDERGTLFMAPIHELIPDHSEAGLPASPVPSRATDSRAYQKALKEAQDRFKVIEPLLALGPIRTGAQVRKVADAHQCNVVTIYRWLSQYDAAESLFGLMRRVRGDKDQGHLPEEAERLMRTLIEEQYLTPQRPDVGSVYRKLEPLILAANRNRAEGETELPLPSLATFKRRIYNIEERKRVSRRFGSRAAEALDPILGHYPGATYPLAVVQIDHTPLDLTLVDNIHRLPVGKAWLTLVMDVFSRVVLGFYLSFDAPSAFSAGTALTHAILPKELWLTRHQEALDRVAELLKEELGPDAVDVEAARLEWPCWGKPVLVKMDNAKEFRGHLLEESLLAYGIHREFRPVLKPRYGGHIERLLGTLLKDIHTLPGTTFSNPKSRAGYDSEGHAAITIEAFETWLTAYLLGFYHRRKHSSLGCSPIKAWEAGLLYGSDDQLPTGVPDRVMGGGADRLRLDFLPFFEATVQRSGIRKDGLVYMSPVLRQYVGARDPEHPTHARKFKVRYDPRDVSVVYVHDPDLDRYFEVRVRQPNFPSMSLWELKATKKFGQERNLDLKDERAIMHTFQLMWRLITGEQQATKATKTARREVEKKRQRDRSQKPAGAVKALAAPGRPVYDLFSKDRKIKALEDIDM